MEGYRGGEELGNFNNPLFEALNKPEEQVPDQVPTVRNLYGHKLHVRGHGAAERTYEDPDTGELFLDM